MTERRTRHVERLGLVLFGLFLALGIAELGLRAAGGVWTLVQEQKNRAPDGPGETFRILAIGESTTAAWADHDYPGQLERILNQQGLNRELRVINGGVPGIKTWAIVKALPERLDEHDPHLVIMMMGINDGGNLLVPDARMLDSNLGWLVENLRVARLLYLLLRADAPESDAATPSLRRLAEACSGYDFHLDAMADPAATPPPGEISEPGELYREQARFLSAHGDYARAAELYRKALEVDAGDFRAAIGLAWMYNQMGEPGKAGELAAGANTIRPTGLGYMLVAKGASHRDDLAAAEAAAKQAVLVCAHTPGAYDLLRLVMEQRGRHAEAVAFFADAAVRDPAARPLLEIARSNQEPGGGLETHHRRVARLVAYRMLDPKTLHSYKAVADLTARRGIPLVAVQYPMLPLAPLREALAEKPGVFFVDNQGSFLEAVEETSFAELFNDGFAVAFGHCTPKGNELLATNVARTILASMFQRELRPPASRSVPAADIHIDGDPADWDEVGTRFVPWRMAAPPPPLHLRRFALARSGDWLAAQFQHTRGTDERFNGLVFGFHIRRDDLPQTLHLMANVNPEASCGSRVTTRKHDPGDVELLWTGRCEAREGFVEAAFPWATIAAGLDPARPEYEIQPFVTGQRTPEASWDTVATVPRQQILLFDGPPR